MRLFVTHRRHYRFTEPQSRLVQLLRLTPGSHAGQSVVSWSIDVGCDARLKQGRDGYGNDITMLYVDGPLDGITLAVSGQVLTEDRAGMIEAAIETLPPVHYLQPTPLTAADAPIRSFVAELGLPGEPLADAHRIADAIHDRIGRDDDAPAGAAAPAVFERASGDAAGITHLLVAAARQAGFPARFVSGHLYRPDLEEAHAAHAWAELHVEGYGWIGFDPAEGQCPTDAYVRVAIGLDHGQAAPVSGARTGGGGESLAVNVRVGPDLQ
jgi:transglutaminase-like putative cysteine protease